MILFSYIFSRTTKALKEIFADGSLAVNFYMKIRTIFIVTTAFQEEMASSHFLLYDFMGQETVAIITFIFKESVKKLNFLLNGNSKMPLTKLLLTFCKESHFSYRGCNYITL